MKQQMFAIYDEKAECYKPPFYLPTVGLAIRSFTDLCNTPETTINMYPSDFKLYKLGTFDDNTGLIDQLIPAQLIGNASEYKTKPQSNNDKKI